MELRGFALALAVPVALCAVSSGCGGNDESYKTSAAYSGRKANMPPVPTLPTNPVKLPDGSYTVYGAIHHLKSRIHGAEVTQKDIALTGYIVDANIAAAPKCAVHPTGKKDPDNCVTEIPSFWIADSKGDKAGQKIRVMGWASNFANVFDAMGKYKNLKTAPPSAPPGKEGSPGYLVKDELWAVDIPYPLPAVGAKVKVSGRYGVIFGKSSAGLVSDPMSGVMTYGTLETIEPPPEAAAFANK